MSSENATTSTRCAIPDPRLTSANGETLPPSMASPSKERSKLEATEEAKLKAYDNEARVLEMSEEHQNVYKDIRDLLDGQQRDKASVWYEVGRKVFKITAASEHGNKAVAKIAKALGRDKTLLYEAGRVAETWTQRQFEELLARRDKVCGNRLSWSHFVELVRVDDSRSRGLLIKKVLNEGLSVRELKRQIAGPKPEEDGEKDENTNVGRALRNFTAAGETIVMKASHWDALIFDVLEVQKEELTAPKMLELLKNARAVQLQARQTCENHMARLDKYIAHAEKLLATPDSVSVEEAVDPPPTNRPVGRPTGLDGQEADNNG